MKTIMSIYFSCTLCGFYMCIMTRHITFCATNNDTAVQRVYLISPYIVWHYRDSSGNLGIAWVVAHGYHPNTKSLDCQNHTSIWLIKSSLLLTDTIEPPFDWHNRTSIWLTHQNFIWLNNINLIWMTHIYFIWLTRINFIWLTHINFIWLTHPNFNWLTNINFIWQYKSKTSRDNLNLKLHLIDTSKLHLTDKSNLHLIEKIRTTFDGQI